MARIARVVVPGYPHHVTQRGSRRQPTFFQDDDYQLYLTLMAKWCDRHAVEIWAYCLMPNHVHLIAIPETPEGLSRAISQAHRQYALEINRREGWTGHFWQERFASFVMDESHLLAAVRYVELNPVMAGLVSNPGDYSRSSTQAHLLGEDDTLVTVKPMLDRITSWSDYLGMGNKEEADEISKHTKTGRPLECNEFVVNLEKMLQRRLRPQKNGRRKKNT